MKMKVNSRMGLGEKCEFFGENGKCLYFTQTEVNSETAVTKIFDSENSEIVSIKYSYSKKIQAKEFLVTIEKEKTLNFILSSERTLECKELNLTSKRGMFDKSFKVYLNKDKIMSARTFTMVNDHLSAKYSVEILDKNELLLCVCSCVMMFVAIAEGAMMSTSNYMGDFE